MSRRSRKLQPVDMTAVRNRLIARLHLKVVGEDIPATEIDDHDLVVNTAILNYIGLRYFVDIRHALWRQLGEAVQFTIGFAPCPGTRNGWMFRWRVSNHHLPATLDANDPEINDLGFMILDMKHVDHLEAMIADTLAPYETHGR